MLWTKVLRWGKSYIRRWRRKHGKVKRLYQAIDYHKPYIMKQAMQSLEPLNTKEYQSNLPQVEIVCQPINLKIGNEFQLMLKSRLPQTNWTFLTTKLNMMSTSVRNNNQLVLGYQVKRLYLWNRLPYEMTSHTGMSKAFILNRRVLKTMSKRISNIWFQHLNKICRCPSSIIKVSLMNRVMTYHPI